MDTEKRSTVYLSPQDQAGIREIQDHLTPILGKVNMRTALSWAISQARSNVAKASRTRKMVTVGGRSE